MAKRKTIYVLGQISVPVGARLTASEVAREVKNQSAWEIESDACRAAEYAGKSRRDVTSFKVRGLTRAQVAKMGLFRENV